MSIFFVSGTINWSRSILYFPTPALEPAISPKSSGFFYRSLELGNQVCLPDVHIAFVVSLLPGPASKQNQRKEIIYTNIDTFTSIFTFILLNIEDIRVFIYVCSLISSFLKCILSSIIFMSWSPCPSNYYSFASSSGFLMDFFVMFSSSAGIYLEYILKVLPVYGLK